ncbi:MAG: nitronate monooxygenase [bacterium]
MKLPRLRVKNFCLEDPIFLGGMGVGVTLDKLPVAVTKEGGLGVTSSAGLRAIAFARDGKVVDTYTAVREKVEWLKYLSGGRPIGINVMCALFGDFKPTILGAVDGGADAIVSGAGLPMELPRIKPPGNTALIPIVSSARALNLILKRWEGMGYRPDAVVVEGPKAGGHIVCDVNWLDNPEYALENILPPILDLASKHGGFPVIVAGGIYTHQDILKFLAMGASGVQMGTRFMVTHESEATAEYKQAVISAGVDDIMVVSCPGNAPASPCGLPLRILKTSPMYQDRRQLKCDKGYVLQRDSEGKLSVCRAMPSHPDCEKFLCICNGLLSSAGYGPKELSLYTVGTNAYRVDRTLSVAELMRELRGE